MLLIDMEDAVDSSSLAFIDERIALLVRLFWLFLREDIILLNRIGSTIELL